MHEEEVVFCVGAVGGDEEGDGGALGGRKEGSRRGGGGSGGRGPGAPVLEYGFFALMEKRLEVSRAGAGEEAVEARVGADAREHVERCGRGTIWRRLLLGGAEVSGGVVEVLVQEVVLTGGEGEGLDGEGVRRKLDCVAEVDERVADLVTLPSVSNVFRRSGDRGSYARR